MVTEPALNENALQHESTCAGLACRSVLVVGAGNIGSHLLPLAARLPDVGCVTIIDHDRYEAKNLVAQDIEPRDVGRPKALVQARRIRRLGSALQVKAIVADLADVPLAVLRCDVVLGCLDSRAARRELGRRAWRLGIPFVDAGVEPTAQLARVSTYVPGPDTACIECLWNDDDYAALAQEYACGGEASAAHATNAPAFLGSLAASLQATACDRLLADGSHHGSGDHELVIDAGHRKSYSTKLYRNARCRFDHAVWNLEPLSAGVALGRLSERAGGTPAGRAYLSVFSQPFVGNLRCTACGHTERVFRPARRLRPSQTVCGACNADITVRGFDLFEPLDLTALSERHARRSLRSLGLRPGDVVTVTDAAGDRHFKLNNEPPERSSSLEERSSANGGY